MAPRQELANIVLPSKEGLPWQYGKQLSSHRSPRVCLRKNLRRQVRQPSPVVGEILLSARP